jgi:hypothetical protein
MDYIRGDKFWEIADFVFVPNVEIKYKDYNLLKNNFDLKKINDINIVYTHTFYVTFLFDLISGLRNKFIIITHNSDVNVDDKLSLLIPDNVIKWYAQNVDVINDRIESIPIGLENKKWHPNLKKEEKIRNIINIKKNEMNWLYINHNINTNSVERQKPYDLLSKFNWVTVFKGKNGQNFDDYLFSLYNHKFMLCPNGNGIDTHRLWESLYVNTIPIVKRGINVNYYNDLPICFVNDWEDINMNYLYEQYDFIIKNKKNNFNKLDFSYWKKKILTNKNE